MYKESDKQTSFFGSMIYEEIIPKDNILKKLSEVVDFSFVNELVKDLYCPNNGRPGWEPQIIFKMLLLQYLYNLSDVEIENEVNDRISFKWFLNLDVNVKAPDSTTLVVFRDRLGDERFAEIFNRIVELARSKNLVSDKLHIVDSTAIRAKVDTLRLKNKDKTNNKPDNNYIDKNSPDKDARIGHQTPKKSFYGYKGYIQMDNKNEIIVSETVQPANEQEANRLPELLGTGLLPGTVLADKAFDTPQNQEFLKKNRIKSGIIKKQIKNYKNISGCFYKSSKQSPEVVYKISTIRKRIEHKIAELKHWHNLRNCRFLGLIKIKIQMTLTCIAVNMKKIIRVLSKTSAPPGKLLAKCSI